MRTHSIQVGVLDKVQTQAIIRESILKDAMDMAPNLRVADFEELRASVGPSMDPEEVLLAGIKESDDPRTVELDGEPIAIFGVVDSHEEIPKVGHVWMLGTNQIKDIRNQFLRRCKEQLSEQEKPYEVLTNFVDARNKVHIKWLRWMGFTIIREVENYGAEGRTFYEFARVNVNV